MIGLVRFIGYFVALAAVDIAVDYWEVRRMNREMKTYRNDNDGTVSAHTVTEDTEGTVMTPGGVSRDVSAGDVLIGTDRPDVYHVAGSDALDGYSEVSDAEDIDAGDTERAGEGDQDSEGFDPSEHNASEVRAYLRDARTAGDRSEFDRVSAAERAGYNRSSALDGEFDR